MVLVGAGLLLGAAGAAYQGVDALSNQTVHADVPFVPAPMLEALPPDRVTQPIVIRPGMTFGRLAQGYGLPAEDLRRAAMEHYDLARIRPDRGLSLTWSDGDPVPVGLTYELDPDHTLQLRRDVDGWRAELEVVEYEEEPGERGFVIQRSLWQDGLQAGLQPGDLARLAEVFEYELDFNTELKAGAVFVVAGTVQTAPGRPVRLGDLQAVRLRNGSKTWTAARHELPDGSDGWYQEDGRSLRKPFLRSPLKFSRVTSGFNPRRFHPVLKRRRPHNGTDFGAPTGTPVRVVADGKVLRAGWAGGHGRFVKVQHDGGYATSYSHLSSIAVKRGQRISQGTLVGKVGSTGLATGPHLHFQMWKGGRYVDPMRTDLPNQAPLPASERARFKRAWGEHVPRLDRLWEQMVPDR